MENLYLDLFSAGFVKIDFKFDEFLKHSYLYIIIIIFYYYLCVLLAKMHKDMNNKLISFLKISNHFQRFIIQGDQKYLVFLH